MKLCEVSPALVIYTLQKIFLLSLDPEDILNKLSKTRQNEGISLNYFQCY